MTLRDILCTSCSDVALSVDESRSAEEVERIECDCYSCERSGKVHLTERDNGEGGTTIGVEFRPTGVPVVADGPDPKRFEFVRDGLGTGRYVPKFGVVTMRVVNTRETTDEVLEQARNEFDRQRFVGFRMREAFTGLRLSVPVKWWGPELG